MKKFLSFVFLFSVFFCQLSAADKGWVTIVDEDFSGLTAGAESAPDMTPLLDDLGWFIHPEILKPYDTSCTYGWGGYNAFSAGGCLAIIDGFINTPTGDYSGNLHVEFRARLMDTEPLDTRSLDILLCRRSALIDFERKPITLTKEWQTFTMDTDCGSYTDCMLQLFTMEDYGFLIDDFYIVHELTGCEAPKATDPYNLVDDGFTAFWRPTADAEEYLLSVYSKDAAGNKLYVFEDRRVEAENPATIDSCDVTGLDPAVDYFYTVKARNATFTSQPSNEMEVFDVSNPVALPASEITADSYTANWMSNPKVDYFCIEQVRKTVMTEDAQDYVVLDEDFSNVHSDWGTEDYPEPGEYTTDYYSIDHLTHTGGWKGSSLQYAEGMLGGMYPNDGSIAGCIVTPVLDLSNNGGLAKVKLRAFAYEGDWLVVQGNAPTNYAGIYFDHYGWVETELELPLCTAEERFYFYSNNYYPFLLDYITVTQDLKKGDEVSVVDRSARAEADARSCRIEGVDLSGDTDIVYHLSAFRYYHGNEKNIWQSPDSEAISVKLSDGITPLCAPPSAAVVYDCSGRRFQSHFPGILIKEGKKMLQK